MTGTRVAILALAAGLAAAPAAAAPKLAPDPFEGIVWKAYDKAAGPHYQVVAIKTKQTIKVQGLDVGQTNTQTFYLRLTPDDKVDGNWVVTLRTVGVKMALDIAGSPMKYDSTDAKAVPNALAGPCQALMKVDLALHIDPRTFAIVKVDGREELAKQLGAANPQMAGALQTVLGDAAIKAMIAPGLSAFPSAERRTGKVWADGRQWTHDNLTDLGPLGGYRHRNNYTWKPDDRVTIESALDYAPPAGPAAGGAPFRVKRGEIEGKSTGESFAKFDRARGRFQEIRTGLNLKGILTIDIGGAESTVQLEQTQDTTITTHDRNPLEGK